MSAFVRLALVALASALLVACPGSVTPRCGNDGSDCSDGTTADVAPSGDAMDAQTAPAAALDAASDGPAAGELGAPCGQDADCHSGVCLSLPVGRCSVACTD